jgi:hypothetical protein
MTRIDVSHDWKPKEIKGIDRPMFRCERCGVMTTNPETHGKCREMKQL